MNHRPRHIGVIAAACIVPLALSGCGQGGQEATPTADDPVTITMWGWDSHLGDYVKEFERVHPEIHVELTNAGQSSDEYLSLNNALAAGSGIPDVAMIEYNALPQYAVSGALADLTDLGASQLDGEFLAGVWSQVHYGDAIVGLPAGSGANLLFYNKTVFDKAGVTEPPTTWEEYYEAAKKIRALGDDYYITAEANDGPGVLESMVWAAGGSPFASSGQSVTIDLDGDEQTQRFVDWWQRLIDEDLIDLKSTNWSEEWYRKLSEGNIASLITGVWMGTMLEGNVQNGAGQWRVAQAPSIDADTTGNGENGGSAWTILEASEHKQAAYTFLEFLATSDYVTEYQKDTGQFPVYAAALDDEEFADAANDYFGGQQVNREYIAAAEAVREGWQYLPYDSYGRTIYGDYAGKAFLGETTFRQAVSQWQDALVEYGEGQGFTVDGGN